MYGTRMAVYEWLGLLGIQLGLGCEYSRGLVCLCVRVSASVYGCLRVCTGVCGCVWVNKSVCVWGLRVCIGIY